MRSHRKRAFRAGAIRLRPSKLDESWCGTLLARLDVDLTAKATSFYEAASTTLAAVLGSITERAA